MDHCFISAREDIYCSIENMQKFARFVRHYCGPSLDDGNKQREAWQVWQLIRSVGGFEYVFTNDLWNELEIKYSCLVEHLSEPLFESACKWTLANFAAKNLKRPLDNCASLGLFLNRPKFNSELNAVVYSEKYGQDFTALMINIDELNKSQLRMYARQLETESHLIESDSDLMKITCDHQGNATTLISLKKSKPSSHPHRSHHRKALTAKDYHQLTATIPREYKFASCQDGLSFLDTDNSNQFAPKLKDATDLMGTTGTENPMRLASGIINLGPNEIEWCCVSAANVPRLRKAIFDDHKVDILSPQSNFKEDFYYCIANKVPVSKFIQEPFKTVVINSGTYYWQKFIGKTRFVEWNFCPLDLHSLSNVHTKSQINNYLGIPNEINAIDFFGAMSSSGSIHLPDDSSQ
jgi:hypothetical protein